MFTDTVSGKSTDRPQLQAMLRFARAGDTIIVHSMDRLARNLMTCAAWYASSVSAQPTRHGRPGLHPRNSGTPLTVITQRDPQRHSSRSPQHPDRRFL